MKTEHLTLKEAVTSGYPYKHILSSVWEPAIKNTENFDFEIHKLEGYSTAQLISNSWEIRYFEKETYTRQELERALSNFYRHLSKRIKGSVSTDYLKECKQEALRAAERTV